MTFPFQSDSLIPAEQLWANLLEYEARPLYRPYTIKSYYSPSPIKIQFRGSTVYISSTKADYYLIDALSDYFIEDQRVRAYKDGSMSAWDYWHLHSDSFSGTVVEQREQLADKVYIPRQFRLTWVKSLFHLIYPWKSMKGKVLLDISAGWGDRLLVAMSLGMEYRGYDPNENLRPGHTAMIKQFGHPDRHRIEYIPFENADIASNSADVVLTSPPFFNLEHYSDHPTQSINRYSGVDEWLGSFLFPSLRTAWRALRPGGHLVLHLGDTYVNPICDLVLEWAETKLEWSKFEGVIGLMSSSRKISPTWVWRKV